MSKKTDKIRVDDELRFLYTNYNHIDGLTFGFVKPIKKTAKESGNKATMISSLDYKEKYTQVHDAGDYVAQLDDGSLIGLSYEFDNKGKILSHCLVYLPCPFADEENDISIEEAQSRYIRADYNCNISANGHTKSHLHAGLSNEGVRLPLAHIISPIEFIWIILKYVYRKSVDTVLSKFINIKREQLLNDDEQKQLHLGIGCL